MIRSYIHVAFASPARRSFCSTRPTFAGHNKWSKIKDKKGTNDMKKNAAYTRARRDIITAVRRKHPEKNSTLAAVLRRLKDIPKENIQDALDTATRRREQNGGDIIYEALAYNTVGLIIECNTDNPARTIKNLREIFNEHSTRLAPVRFLFDRKGSVKVLTSKEREDHESHLEALIETALNNGAEDLDEISSTEIEVEMEFTCAPESLGKLTSALTATGICQTLLASEIVYKSIDTESRVCEENPEGGPDMATRLNDLVGKIEADEDTKRVWTSWVS
ncbi:DUF28-domain-containing protein [Mycena crocata]|nr:DUF28-domain-containing protein [Mycena crocata]